MKETFTYQTRLVLNEKAENILSEYASLFNSIERRLYAQLRKGKRAASCKNEFLKKYGITARQFNACRINLEGKIAACEATQKQAAINLRQRIDLLDKEIKRLEKKSSKAFVLHQKKRRKYNLTIRLANMQKNMKDQNFHLCFGGKKLFRSQFFLEKNRLTSHEQWKSKWVAQRNSEFFVLGSKDETTGNQSCTITLRPDGKLTLRLRLPNQVIPTHSKYLLIDNVSFAYGQEAILASLYNQTAISYRFKKDHKSWKIYASTNLKKPDPVTQEDKGVIGIDLNTDHIAYVETDRFGNPIDTINIPWNSYGKTKQQLCALIGDISKQIIEKAKQTKKPIVIEKLDFRKKKNSLKEKRLSRLLSSFAYTHFFNSLSARAYKHGITLHRVNPAYTSLIGSINYAKRYGLSTHLAAALCIARRHQKFSEAPSSSTPSISDGKGRYVAFVLPVRNRAKHVWHFWEQVKKKVTMALAAHFRAIHYRSLSP